MEISGNNNGAFNATPALIVQTENAVDNPMKKSDPFLSDPDDITQEIQRLILLLPPPISLDILCTITGHPPVKTLQLVEDLVQTRHVLRDKDKGAGYYYLSEFQTAQKKLDEVPQPVLFRTAQQAVSGILDHLPDGPKRWLHLAHIYQTSGLPLQHFREIILAGHHCRDLNLPMDAALYYQMALEPMKTLDLNRDEQSDFIDAVIGFCTVHGTSFSKKIQRGYLSLALDFSGNFDDPIRLIKLRLLTAKTYLRSIRADEAEKHLSLARQMLSRHDLPNEIHLQVALVYSEFLFFQGYLDKSIEQYESVIGSHEALPTDVDTLKNYVRMGWTYGAIGEPARGMGLIRSVRKKADEFQATDLKRYATLILVIVLLEAGWLEEGELFLDKVFDIPEERLDHYTLWPGNGKRAYLAYCRGDFEKAYAYRDKAWKHSKAMGTPHHRGADNLEVALGLEEMGMVHPEWTFDFDVERLLRWPDIFMQGVAYRFRALKAYRSKKGFDRIKFDLKKSILLLTQSGAKIELAHAKILMARIRIEEKKFSKAENLLKTAWDVFSKVNPNLYPKDLKPYLDRTSKNALWVESLLEVGEALRLSSVKNRNELLSHIIRHSMRIAGAERGGIFLRNEQKLEMVTARNLEPSDIVSDEFSDRMPLIEAVFESGMESITKVEICSPGEEKEFNTYGGWVGCFPIRIKGRVMGVIFIDNGYSQRQLPEDEVAILRIISNQAAVTLENLVAYEEIVDLNQELKAQTHFYRESFESNPFKTQMIGRSEPFKKMLNLIRQVASSDTTVMITGETGVGKDMVAQAIHQHSSRSDRPFIAVNVVSLSPELIASELFGHEKGAFTGASQARKGRFELASNGTLFLDDIDAFSMDIQVKMLRVLEAKEFERVGGTQTLKTNFRLLASSNKDLEELVEKGLFRSDFYYRLNVFPIKIPALRERKEDIPGLAHFFLEMFSKRFKKAFKSISKKDLSILMDYHWPGNIRELRHVIERAVLMSSGSRLIIPPLDSFSACFDSKDGDEILPLKEMEANHILKALSRCKGKVSGKGGAAELLELKPTTLYSKMKRLGIQRDTYRFTSDQ